MNWKGLLAAVIVVGALFWLFNHWFYWVIIGIVLIIIADESGAIPQTGGRKRQLHGKDILIYGTIVGLVLKGADNLLHSMF